jgi:aspartate-semialdehyde dehydrogenase
MSKNYRVAIVGATGAVGLKFIECIEQRKFPCSEVVLYASPKSRARSST